jgi:hypothetical protein
MLLIDSSSLKEKFDDGMTDLYGPRWEEGHPEFDGSVIYEKAGRMPHGRLAIANELFDKVDKSTIKATRIRVSQPDQSSSENEHLRRENRNLRRENEQLRGMAHVVRVNLLLFKIVVYNNGVVLIVYFCRL